MITIVPKAKVPYSLITSRSGTFLVLVVSFFASFIFGWQMFFLDNENQSQHQPQNQKSTKVNMERSQAQILEDILS